MVLEGTVTLSLEMEVFTDCALMAAQLNKASLQAHWKQERSSHQEKKQLLLITHLMDLVETLISLETMDSKQTIGANIENLREIYGPALLLLWWITELCVTETHLVLMLQTTPTGLQCKPSDRIPRYSTNRDGASKGYITHHQTELIHPKACVTLQSWTTLKFQKNKHKNSSIQEIKITSSKEVGAWLKNQLDLYHSE